MSWKFCFLFIIFSGSVWCMEDAAGSNVVEEQKFFPEEDCSRSGGICLHRRNCPLDKISEAGHCPEQSGLGAVCCNSVSIGETRCQHLGGACKDSCPQRITITTANDCPDGEKCCALVI